jgi:hypothetical protein
VSLHQIMPAARRTAGLLLCGLVMAGIPAFCQESAAGAAPAKKSSQDASKTPDKTAEKTAEKEPNVSILRRFSFGGRIDYVPKNLVRNRTDIDYEPTATIPSNTTYKTSTKSDSLGAGPTVEFSYNKRFRVSADFLFHRYGYGLSTTAVIYPDNSTLKSTTTTTEVTRANFWDVPLLLHVSHLPFQRLPSNFFVSGGGVFRFVSHVRTDTGVTYNDGTTSCDQTAKTPLHTRLGGITVGAGMRFRDDFGVKTTIEARYTHWGAKVFSMPGPVSPSQIDVLLGFTF